MQLLGIYFAEIRWYYKTTMNYRFFCNERIKDYINTFVGLICKLNEQITKLHRIKRGAGYGGFKGI